MAQDSTDIKETIGALDDYVLLGRSGLRISPLCLGALTFGETFGIGSNYEESKNVFDYYFEKGGNFIDTANMYNIGESERFLGEYIADKRSQVVISTKYTANLTTLNPNVRYNPNAGGNHRKSLVENLDESLKRLGTGYIDLLYVHAWEFRTPIEEIMRSLDDVVRSGKVLYTAISDAPGWVISRANATAELRGWSRFIGLQTRYNLLERSLEHEIQTCCAEFNVGIIPWGCVAEGFLTGKYTRESVANLKSSNLNKMRNNSVVRSADNEQNWKILDEVVAIAAETKKSPAQVVLNWISQKPGVSSPLIGARTKAQLVDNLGALEFKLTPEQMARLDYISAPKEIPFPYSAYSNFEKVIGKGIQIPDKYKPVIMLGAQKKM
ncbi:aldo/keto reductase [Gigaspora margarita]|uniref:Aldo/keto reductase n=1 Tax=Gigaspora margarita TaxID=4874 RepID=A0A8H3XIM4_GIGMA|nr:aldo/keto reductase [Gigaspora margarita]